MIKKINAIKSVCLGILSCGILLPIPQALHAGGFEGWSIYDLPALSIVTPEDEAQSNPPFIHWQALKNAAYYEIVLKGTDSEYRWKSAHSFYTPERAVPAGFYSVEVTAFDESGTKMMPPSTKVFRVVKPVHDRVMDFNAISFREGVNLLFSPQQIRAIRESDANQQAQFRDRLIENARQPLPEIMKDLKEPPAYENGIWDFNTWKHNNNLCSTIEDYVLNQIAAWMLTGEEEFYTSAHGILLEIATWNPVGSTSAWENDHSAQALLHALAVGYNTMKERLSDSGKKHIKDSIAARSADVYHFINPFIVKSTSAGPMNDPYNNHPWFSASSLGFGGIALWGEVPEAEQWVSFTSQLFYGYFLPRGDSSGGWHEGIDYMSYTLFFVFQFSDALYNATGLDLYQHPWLSNTAFFKAYVHPPEGGYVPFGDCKHNPPSAFDKLIMMRLASRYNDPLAWKYVDFISAEITRSYLLYALQWADRSGVGENKIPEMPFAFHFEDIGWVVSNSDIFNADNQILFAFRSGRFHGRSFGHSHGDQNSFIFTAGGEKLLWDAGYYDSYLSPHHRNYSRLSMAHNTILIDDAGQVVHTGGVDAKIIEYSLDGERLMVKGDASLPIVYGGRVVKFIRSIEYIDRRDLIISDDIMAKELSNISFLLHSVYPIVYNPGDRSIVIQGNKFQVQGTFETSEPVDAIVRDRFPVQPNLPSNVLTERDYYPAQYHLELRTVNKIETWTPTLKLTLSKTQSE